ncbi:hypothetical protein SNE40_023718 [Patella caerulea]|uniref:CCHC-type domain-containing protein n=1 Tax=Patella caerulea TaxID=87958 RepID=A0AAN8G780_PATCE
MTESHSARRAVFDHKAPVFSKDCTVLLSVKNKQDVTALRVIKAVRDVCGDDAILTCIPRTGDDYEVTLVDSDCALRLVESNLVFDDVPVFVRHISSKIKVVSFMHLSGLISDGEIERKLKQWRLELLGPIKRRRYEHDGIFDGTRFVKVRFPPDVSSLPYSVGFQCESGVEYFSIRHDHQEKVCFHCLSHDHLLAGCPSRVCRRCKRPGHIQRYCTVTLCSTCKCPLSECSCQPPPLWNLGATDVPTAIDGNILISDVEASSVSGAAETIFTINEADNDKSLDDEHNLAVIKPSENDPKENNGDGHDQVSMDDDLFDDDVGINPTGEYAHQPLEVPVKCDRPDETVVSSFPGFNRFCLPSENLSKRVKRRPKIVVKPKVDFARGIVKTRLPIRPKNSKNVKK